MIRPDSVSAYEEVDLKLGIKSSLRHVKSALALAILLWECSDRPAELIYSEQNGNGIVILNDLKQKVIDSLSDICESEHIDTDTLISNINENQLFKSQMEALIVAFELVWKLARVSFVGKNMAVSTERTGGKRYQKKLTYTLNVDIIHSVIDCNKDACMRVLMSWMGVNVNIDANYETRLLNVFTALSESAVFKLTDAGKDIIFNQEGIYRKVLETGQPVDINGDNEPKGSLRILKSLLSDGLNPYLDYSNSGSVTAKADKVDELADYRWRVDAFLQLSTAKVTEKSNVIETTVMNKVAAEDQKQGFKEWLEQQKKTNGEPYSENTINSYISQMQNGYRSFEKYKNYESVFDIQDAKELEEYIGYLFNAEGFDAFNDTAGNKACSYGLLRYKDFLRSNIEIELVYDVELDLPATFERNRIVFGAPGTGKSYMLNKDKNMLLESGGTFERVTFHPDYSYAQFVGTYKPVMERHDIAYRFVPGPFMRTYVEALRSAMSDNPKPHLLLIEEINRANVAAVFGEVFQLLDRDDIGKSEYEIKPSEDVRQYLADEFETTPDKFSSIMIPNNMFIWATMNSADQGVFPMDTAFKRRWDFTYLGIDDNEDGICGKYVYLAADRSQKIEWNSLRKAINQFLAGEKINEDKQLGPYFISKSIVVPKNGDEIDRDKFIATFKNKVIMYLFEDAAKQKRSKLFEGCSRNSTRYSEICREFDNKGIGIFNSDIQTAARIIEPQTNQTEGEL